MCIWALGRYQQVGADSGKEIDTYRLGVDNLPGRENRFPGDREFN
jgi:hypothetical protein